MILASNVRSLAQIARAKRRLTVAEVVVVVVIAALVAGTSVGAFNRRGSILAAHVAAVALLLLSFRLHLRLFEALLDPIPERVLRQDKAARGFGAAQVRGASGC